MGIIVVGCLVVVNVDGMVMMIIYFITTFSPPPRPFRHYFFFRSIYASCGRLDESGSDLLMSAQ